MNIKLPNGKIISGIPEGTSKEDIADKVVAAGMATYDELGVQPKGSTLVGIGETAQAVGANVLGAVGAGLGGIYELIRTGDTDKAANMVKGMQQEISTRFAPQTRAGQAGVEEVAQQLGQFEESLRPLAAIPAGTYGAIADPLNSNEAYQRNYQKVIQEGLGGFLGDDTFEATGSPAAATAATLLPSVAEIATGRIAGRVASGPETPKVRQQQPLTEGQQTVKEGERLGVNVLTSDVKPPTSYAGKWTQKISEKLGPLGSGVARQIQQKAREDVVENVANEFNVTMDSPFFDDIITSMTAKNAKKLEIANTRRRRAIDTLSGYGDVGTPKALEAASDQLQKQINLKGAAKQDVINSINNYAEAVSGQDFNKLAAVRTELIREIKDLEGSSAEGKTSKVQALTSIKKGIDEDMSEFAKSNDRGAAAQWLKSNKDLAEQLTTVKQSELKRLIDKGDVKPELVSTILRGGNRSELMRIKSALGPKGLASARAAIVKDALDRSGFFRGDPNPNRFATELGKTKTQQAIDVLFNETDKKQLNGLRKLLDATRRAQDASVVTETGAQLVPYAGAGLLGAGATAAPITTLATATTLSAIAKTYESKSFRNLLLKLESSRKGSKEERRILETLIPSVVASLQAPREEQSEKQRQE